MPRRTAALALLLAWAVAAAGCARDGAPNVVLVSVDTLRADALGAYGGPVPTPAFDAIAAGGVLFENAVAASPETAPSHATLLTGIDVQRHGVVENGIALPAAARTLAEAFREAGFATGGFVSSFVLDPRFGWGRGFQRYDADFPRAGETLRQRIGFASEHSFAGYDRRAPLTNRAALAWLEEAREPFLLFVHYFDPHAPYAGPPALARRVPERYARRLAARREPLLGGLLREITPGMLAAMIRNYHAEVLVVDAALAELLEALDRRGCRERTLVAVTADHGEGLGEHGVLDHAPHLYEEQVRVPLLLQWPRGLPAGLRISAPVGLVDVTPTLAELAGVPLGSEADGRSFAAALREGREPEARPLLGRRRHYPEEFAGHRGTKYFVRDGRWKYIRATESPDELYDLSADAGELRNLHRREPEAAERLGALLDAHLAAHPRRDERPALSEEERRGLEALGYAD